MASSYLGTSLQAQDSSDANTANSARYKNCMRYAEGAPDRGINLALEWQSEGGGVPARHCEAVGLYNLKEYAEAAYRLSKVAADMRVGKDMPIIDGVRTTAKSMMLSSIYGQAAHAWLLADMLSEAIEDIDKAVALAGDGTRQYRQLLIERAEINAADGDYSLTLRDLELVLAVEPNREDAQLLYVAASRIVGNTADAYRAVNKLLDKSPDHIVGLLERANILDVMGRLSEAKADWIKIIKLAPNSTEAVAAQTNLERVSLKPDQ